MSLFRNVLTVATTQAGLAPLALVLQVVLARWLSAGDRGLYAVGTELVVLTVVIGNLGLAPAAIFRLRRVGSRPDVVVSSVLLAAVAISIAILAAGLLFLEPLARRLVGAGTDPTFLVVAMAAIPFQLAGHLLTAVARGLGRFDLHNAYQAALAVGILGLLLLVPTLGSVHVVSAMAAFLAASVLATLGLGAAVLRTTGWGRFRVRELVGMLGYGSRTHLENVLANLHQRVDVLLLAWLTSRQDEVAVYAVAVAVVNRIRLVPAAIALASFPEIASRNAADAAELAARVLRHSILWVAASVAAMALLAPLLLPLLFGDTYRASVEPLLLLLPGTAFLTVQMVLGRYFAGMDRLGINIASQASGTVLNLVLNVLWIPALGARGAALASLVSYSAQGVLILFLFRAVSGHPLRSAVLAGREDLRAYRRQIARGWQRITGGAP